MNVLPRFHRSSEIHRIRGDLERESFPRAQMLLIVTLTGATGLLASYILLHAGLVQMWLRYFVSVSAAYLMFLVLLWLWLRTRAEDYADVPDISGAGSPSSGSGNSGSFHSGKGGDFGGGGASGSFDGSSDGVSFIGDSGGSVGDALGSAAEAEEFAIPLVVLVLVGIAAFSSVFMIYSAPSLFAELLVDGVLSASLYRKLRGIKTRHWLETAVRRTAWPFIFTALLISASGWAMALYVPNAHSIGDVISNSKQSR